MKESCRPYESMCGKAIQSSERERFGRARKQCPCIRERCIRQQAMLLYERVVHLCVYVYYKGDNVSKSLKKRRFGGRPGGRQGHHDTTGDCHRTHTSGALEKGATQTAGSNASSYVVLSPCRVNGCINDVVD